MKKTLKGSYTVEASLIFPLVIVLCVLLIYLTFFLYDECSSWQSAYIAALRTETSCGAEAGKEEAAGRTARQLLSEQLLAASRVVQETHVDAKRIEVLVKADVYPPVGRLLVNQQWHLESRGEVKRLRPVEYIRLCRRLKKAAGWIFD